MSQNAKGTHEFTVTSLKYRSVVRSRLLFPDQPAVSGRNAGTGIGPFRDCPRAIAARIGETVTMSLERLLHCFQQPGGLRVQWRGGGASFSGVRSLE